MKWCDPVLLGVFSEHLLLAKATQAQCCKNEAWHPLPSRSLSAKVATEMNSDKHRHPGVEHPFPSLFTMCINLYMMHFSTFLFSEAVLWFIYWEATAITCCILRNKRKSPKICETPNLPQEPISQSVKSVFLCGLFAHHLVLCSIFRAGERTTST